MKTVKTKGFAGLVLGVAITVAAVYFTLAYQDALSRFLLSGGVGPVLFLVLMALLPIAGFPISLFLFLVGLQFGLVRGLVLTAVIFALHLPIVYLLTHTLVRRHIEALLQNTRYQIPNFNGQKGYTAAVIFMAVPGLSYTLKNFLLALSGISFRAFMTIGWPVNLALSIPFIGLGESAVRLDLSEILLYSFLLLAIYAGILGLKAVYNRRRR